MLSILNIINILATNVNNNNNRNNINDNADNTNYAQNVESNANAGLELATQVLLVPPGAGRRKKREADASTLKVSWVNG